MGLFSDTNDQIKRQMTPQFSTGGVDPIMGGQLSFEQQVVRKLVEERGEPEAAARAYPSVYKAMYGGSENGGQEQETQPAQQSSAPTFDQYRGTTQSNTQLTTQQDGSGQVSVYDASTGGYRTISIGKRAATYNDDAFDLNKVNFDTSAMVRADTDQQWADSLRVDYSKLGGLNGGKSNNAYNMYSNTDLLPNLFAWRLGLRPAEVNALDLHTRREVATKLLSDYYDSAGDELRSRIGDKGAWTNTLLRAYGMEDTDTNNGYDKNALEHGWNFAKSVFKGAGDAVSNYEAAATAILGDGKYEDGDLGKDLAGWLQSVDQANQSESGQYLQQRLEQLMREERYLDAATHILTHGDLLAAYGGTMLGSAFMDGLVAKGLITAGGLVLSPFTGGTSAAAATGYNLASTASSLAQKLAKLGKVSTLAAVSGTNMTGGVAKEIMLTGNEIPKGSDVHKALIAYGLIGGALSGLPGTVERQIFDRIMASPAGKSLTEQAGMATAKSIREALEQAGYRFTEKGIVKPLARKAIDWAAKPLAKGAMEGVTEYAQEAGGSIIRQGAGQDGSFDDSKVDFAQAHVDGMTGAVLGTALGTGGGLLSQAGASRRDSRLIQAYEPAKQAEATQRAEQRAFQDFARENSAMANDVAANAWRYNTDGTLKTEEEQNAVSPEEIEAYISGDVSALTPEQRQHRVNVVSAVLRTEFDSKRKADEENAKTRTQDEDISMAGFEAPQDIVVDTNVAQQIRDEYTRRIANLEASIRRTNVGDMYVAPDVMKDVPNVTDSDRKALSRIISKIKSDVDKERKAIEKEQVRIDDKYKNPVPEQLRNHPSGQQRLAEEQRDRSALEERRRRVDEMDMAHANSYSPAGVVELLAKAEANEWVPGQHDNVVRLSVIMADAVANAGYEPDGPNPRFNRMERQAVIDSVADLAGAKEDSQLRSLFQMEIGDLPEAIRLAENVLFGGPYAMSADAERRRTQLDMLKTIVAKDMPEMLGNWRANKDKKTKGVKALMDGWNGDDVAYTNAVDSISRTLGWGKYKNTEGKAELARGNKTAEKWTSLVNDGKLRANPVAALQELYDTLKVDRGSIVDRDSSSSIEQPGRDRRSVITKLMSEVKGYQRAAKQGRTLLPVRVSTNADKADNGFVHENMAAIPAQLRNKTGDYLERIAAKLRYNTKGNFEKKNYYADPHEYLARFRRAVDIYGTSRVETQWKDKRKKDPLSDAIGSSRGDSVVEKVLTETDQYLVKVGNMITEYNANADNPDFVFEPDWDGELSSDAEVEKYIRGAEAAKEAAEKDKEVKQKGKKRGDEADAKAKEVMETEVPINPPPEPQKSKTTKKDPLAGTETSTESIHAQMVKSLVGGTRVVSNMRIVIGNAVRDMFNKAKEHAGSTDGVVEYFRNFVTAVKATNPDDVVLHRTLDVLAEKFDQQDKVDKFLKRSLDDKKRRTSFRKDSLTEINNQIFHRMLEASGTIEAGDIKDLMDLVAASDPHEGYKLFYAQLNKTAVENNVAIEYVKDNHPSGKDIAAMWFPDDNRIRIYGAKSQQDVAASLLHEYMHVAFSTGKLNGEEIPIFKNLASLVSDNSSRVHSAAVRVESLAKTNDQLRHELQSVGVLDDAGKLADGGMEEFIVNFMTDPKHRSLFDNDDKISGLFRFIMREAAKSQNPNGPDKLIPKNQRLVKKDTHFGIGELAYDQTPKARTRMSKRIDPFTGERIKPNESDPKDRTTAVTFGFSEDNPNVGSLATAWYNAGGGWTFFYYDKNDTAHRIEGLDHAGVMKSAQDLGLWIDQVQKDVLMNTAPTKANEFFDRNAAGTRKLLQLINRATGGTDDKISAPVRWITRAFQSVAVNQAGLDHWFAFYENALFNTTGKDMRGKIQTEINRIKTYTSAQLYRPGVGGNKSIYDLKNDLERYMKSTGWSEAKINKTMYAMMAGKRHYDIMTRQKTDPRWKGMPMDPNANVTGFKLDDGTPDPTGEKYLATLSIEERRTADELAKLVTSLNDSVLDFEHQAGRISDAQYEQMRGQFYVPLRNDTDEATAFQRMAIGRHSYADDPLSHLLANHEARVIAAERSSIYQAFMDMVEANPIPGFVTFNSSTLKNKGDGEYAMMADGFIEGNSITFYRNGEKVRMTVVDLVVAKAMKKAGERATSAYFDTMAKVTGYMGLLRTSDPVFMKTAWFRDATMVLTNIQAAFRGKEDFSDLEWMALSGAVFRDMARYLPIMWNGRRDPENADFRYKVYRTEGGIGNTSAFSIDAVKKSLEVNVFESGSIKSTAKRKFDGYLDLLHISDDAARFSLWMNYLEKKHGGKFASEADLLKYLKDNPEIADRARDASKNITGNFEQRGVSRGMRSHFVFWNAIMKGLQNVYGMLNPRYGYYGMKSLGFLAAYIMMSGSDEEDEDGKLKESRTKNMGNVITIGGIDFPVAQELRGVIHLAQAFKYGVFRDDWSWEKTVKHVSDGIIQSVGIFTPSETDDALTNAVYAFTPTIAQPITLQVFGKTFFGSDIAPDPYDSEGKKWTDAPDYLRGTSNTSDIANGFAEKLFHLTSGTLDVAPNGVDMWLQQLLGSVWSRYRNVDKEMAKGASFPEALGKLFTQGHEHVYNVYALRDEWDDRIKAAKQSLRLPESGTMIEGEKSLPPEYHNLKALETALSNELKSTGDETGAVLSDLYKQLRAVRASDSPSPDEVTRIAYQIEQLTHKRNVVYGKYLRELSRWGY